MSDASTVESRFHPAPNLSAKCPSTSYTNFRPARDPKAVSASEEEVNRRILEILRRMTTQQAQDKFTNSSNRPLRPAKRSTTQNRDLPKPVKTRRLDFENVLKPSIPVRVPIKAIAPRPAVSLHPISSITSEFNATLSTSIVTIPTHTFSSTPSSTLTSTVTCSSKSHTRTTVIETGKMSTSNTIGFRRCSCSRSSCLKLYCECFAAGALCSSGCSCRSCYNVEEHDAHRQKAIMRIMNRKPDAFQSKITHSSENTGIHTRGCNCKRSGCLKNYCECFEARILCTSRCRCWYCYNTKPEDEVNSDQPRKLRSADNPENSSNRSVTDHSPGASCSPEGIQSRSVPDPPSPSVSSTNRPIECDVSWKPDDTVSRLSQEATSTSSEESFVTSSVAYPSKTQPTMASTPRLGPTSVETPLIAPAPNPFVDVLTKTPAVAATLRPAAVTCASPPWSNRVLQPHTQTVISIPAAAATSNLLTTWLMTLLSQAATPPNITSIPLPSETLNLLNLTTLNPTCLSALVTGVPPACSSSSVTGISTTSSCNTTHLASPSQPSFHTPQQTGTEEMTSFDRLLNQGTQFSSAQPLMNSDLTSTVDLTQYLTSSPCYHSRVVKSDSDTMEATHDALDKTPTPFVVKPEPTESDCTVPPNPQPLLLTNTRNRCKSLSSKVTRLSLEVNRLNRIVRKQGRLINQLRLRSTCRRSPE